MTAQQKLHAAMACLAVCLLAALLMGALVRRASFAFSFALMLIVAGTGLAAISLAIQSTH